MPSFPALDAEPPPRPFWRTALVPSAVLAAAALIVVLVLTLSGNGSSAKPGAPPPPAASPWAARVAGAVIGWNFHANTLIAMTAAGQARNGPALASNLSSPPVVQGSEMLANSGRVLRLQAGTVTSGADQPATRALATQPFGSSPFADLGKAVVEGGRTADGDSLTPFIVNLRTGISQRMPGAPVAGVAGDPRGFGAWVTVLGAAPDARVDYRTPGKAPTTLITTSQLQRLTGFTHSRGLRLTPYPSPSGRLIAIEAQQTGAAPGAPDAIVVLSRSGHQVAQFKARSLTDLVWFASGRELLVVRSENALSTWVLGHNPRTVDLPVSPGGWGDCILAPAAPYAVCASFTFEGVASQWALVRLSDGAVAVRPANEIPVDWP